MSVNTQRIVAYNGYPVPDSNGRATNTLGLTIKDGGASANLIQTSIFIIVVKNMMLQVVY
jgi:hypothetical protein